MSTSNATPAQPAPTEKLSTTNLRIPFIVVAELQRDVAAYSKALETNVGPKDRQNARDKARNSALLADRLFESALKVTGSHLLHLGQEGRSLCQNVLNVIYTVANAVQNDADMKSQRMTPVIASLTESETALKAMLERAHQEGLA